MPAYKYVMTAATYPVSYVTSRAQETATSMASTSRSTARTSIFCIAVVLAAHAFSAADASRQLLDNDHGSRLQPPCSAGIARGPSSSQDAYLVPYPGSTVAKFVAILTVNDSAPNGYKLVGIPDGLGAYEEEDAEDEFVVLMNHENRDTAGAVRSHGARGAFVSKWAISKSDLAVLKGEDLIKKVWAWNRVTKSYLDPATSPPVAMQRFCSATLAKQTAFYNRKSGKGTRDRLFLNGEENDLNGRAFAHVASGPYEGNTFELPHFSQGGWENISPNENLHKLGHSGAAADKTVVMATDDNGHNRVFMYVGEKQTTGTPVEKAGLLGGKLYVIYLENIGDEILHGSNLVAGDTVPFTATLLGNDMSGLNGAGPAVRAAYLPVVNTNPPADPKNTKFDRPEDGNWDPKDPSIFYFACTAAFNATGRHSRLWKLEFEDPTLTTSTSGVATVLISGPDGGDLSGPKMMDNLGINDDGTVILQEDVGNQPHLGRVWKYELKSGDLEVIGQHNPAFFSPPVPVKTTDEESSGVIPVEEILGDGWWLLDVQAHKTLPNDLVEDGQLLAMYTGKCKRRD